MIGENFKRFNHGGELKKLTENVRNALVEYNNRLKFFGYHDEKCLILEKAIELAEYELYCHKHELSRR